VTPAPHVLALNGGSSSIRFALFGPGASAPLVVRGKLDLIGQTGAAIIVAQAPGGPARQRVSAPDFTAGARTLLAWLEAQPWFALVGAVGHRVVHGLTRDQPARVNAALVAELRRITPYAPDHLPVELELIEAVRRRHPRLPQVACFDTAFHRTLPEVARVLPLPGRCRRRGVQRYGFHGLSYEYLASELRRLGDPAIRRGRVILAHLGNGASLAAVRDGRSVETTMGFTPAAGLVMGTRSGDLDPGLVAFLARAQGLTPPAFDRMVNHQAGLLGLSGTTADVRTLNRRAKRDRRAALALEVFAYQAAKWIGALTAVLGGLDTLVFAGGIGENDAGMRERICARLGYLGVRLDPGRNRRNAAVISRSRLAVRVRVIPTDEEKMIARSTGRLLRRPAQP